MESVQHVKLIRAFVNEEEDYQKLKHSAQDCYDTEKICYDAINIWTYFSFFTNISQLVAYGYGAYLIINQELTVGELITFSLLLAQFSGPMMQLGNQVAQFTQSAISFDRVTEVLQAKPEIVDRDKAISINSFEKIEFSKYTFSYPKTDLEILKGLDLNIISGKSLGIVGKTGSGKSTLIRQLLRRFPVNDDDSLKIDGVSINEYKNMIFAN